MRAEAAIALGLLGLVLVMTACFLVVGLLHA